MGSLFCKCRTEFFGAYEVGFFAWEATWGKFWWLISSKGWDVLYRTSVSCAKWMKNWLITSSFTAWKQVFYGSWFFSLFGVIWVLHATLRRTLLSWHESFVGKKWRKAWRMASLCVFGLFGRKEIKDSLKMWNSWTKYSNMLLWVLFWNGLECKLITDH